MICSENRWLETADYETNYDDKFSENVLKN